MRVHHLDCATMCPFGARLLTGEGSWLGAGLMVGHCLLVEARHGLILVDTGFGTEDLADPAGRMGRGFLLSARPRLDPLRTAVAQVRALGFNPTEVRDIVVTHLDVDHAGGLSDFPLARVHVWGTELDAATARATFLERERYRPAQIAHGPQWVRHAHTGDAWKGFDAVRAVGETDDEVLMVPLHGHTRGHCAVAVRTPERWLLHCGDGYFHRDEMRENNPGGPAGIHAYQRLLAMDETARLSNQARLRALKAAQGGAVRVFCAHDAVDFAACIAESRVAGEVPAT